MSRGGGTPAAPAGWRRVSLSDVATITFSSVDKKAKSSEQSVHLCNYLDVYENDYIRKEHAFMEATASPAEILKFGLQSGDVVITKDSETPNDIGIPALIESVVGTLVCGYHLAIIRPKGDADSLFLAKLLGHDGARRHFAKAACGSTRYGLTKAAVEELPMWWAPHPAQDGIAQVLRVLDEAIRKTEGIIAKLKMIRQGLLHDLLTRGVHEGGRLRPSPDEAPHVFEDSPLGKVPSTWQVGTLQETVNPTRPIVYGILMPGTGFSGGVPVVKVKNIVGGHIQEDDLLLTSPAIDAEYRRSRLSEGDLLFTIRGTVGRMAFVPARLAGANITQDTARVSISGANQRFVSYYLEMPIPRRFIETHTVGQAVKGINLRDLRRVPLAFPPIHEQEAVASVLSAADSRIDAEAATLLKLRTTGQGIRDDLLTGRVRALVSEVAEA